MKRTVKDTNYAINKPKETKVILVSGVKRAGKDHVSQLLKEYIESFNFTCLTYAYADPLKECIEKTFDISRETLDNYKNDETDDIVHIAGKSFNMREVLQRFGTEAMQSVFGFHVWRDKAKEFVKNSDVDYVIITDFRFPNEYIDSYIINIKNDEVEANTDHKSENSLDEFKFDFIIDNTGKPSKDKIIEQFDEMTKFN